MHACKYFAVVCSQLPTSLQCRLLVLASSTSTCRQRHPHEREVPASNRSMGTASLSIAISHASHNYDNRRVVKWTLKLKHNFEQRFISQISDDNDNDDDGASALFARTTYIYSQECVQKHIRIYLCTYIAWSPRRPHGICVRCIFQIISDVGNNNARSTTEAAEHINNNSK